MPPGDENPNRKGHVKRIFQQDDPNDPRTINPDIWVDVLRIDELPVSFQSTESGELGQIIYFELNWNDDPNNPDPDVDASNADSQGENAADINSRETFQRTIKNPTSPDDKSESVLLWIVDRLRVARDGKESGETGLGVQYVFNNTPVTGDPDNPDGIPNTERETTVIKVVNNDLNGMKMSDDNGSNPLLPDWDTYFEALQAGRQDDSSHLDVDVADNYWVSFGADEDRGYEGQIIEFVLQPGTTEVENFFAPGNMGAVDDNGDPSVVRTDPLQIIVNTRLGGLAVIFGPEDADAPIQKKTTT